MRSYLSSLYSLILLLLLPVVAYAQPKSMNPANAKPESGFGAVLKDLATTWWLWLGIIVILGLVGLLFYLRNKSDD